MRFLADENFPGAAVTALIDLGHDVLWMRTAAPATKDQDVLAIVIGEERVLLTFDKDFGELCQHAQLPRSCGVILFRLPMQPAADAGDRLARIIIDREDWAGHFSVVERARVRMRPLSTDVQKSEPNP